MVCGRSKLSSLIATSFVPRCNQDTGTWGQVNCGNNKGIPLITLLILYWAREFPKDFHMWYRWSWWYVLLLGPLSSPFTFNLPAVPAEALRFPFYLWQNRGLEIWGTWSPSHNWKAIVSGDNPGPQTKSRVFFPLCHCYLPFCSCGLRKVPQTPLVGRKFPSLSDRQIWPLHYHHLVIFSVIVCIAPCGNDLMSVLPRALGSPEELGCYLTQSCMPST